MALSSTIAYCEDQDVFDIYPRVSEYEVKIKLESRWQKSGARYTYHDAPLIEDEAGILPVKTQLFANGKDLGGPEEDIVALNHDDEWIITPAYALVLYQSTTNPNDMIMEIGEDYTNLTQKFRRKASRLVESDLGSGISREILKDREGNYSTSIIQLTALKTAILFVKAQNPLATDLIPLQAEYDDIKDKIISGKIVVGNHLSPDAKKGILRTISQPTFNDVFPVELKGFYDGSNYELLKIELLGSISVDDNELKYTVYGKSATSLKNELLINNKIVSGDFQSLGLGTLEIRFGVAEYRESWGRVFGNTDPVTPFTLKEGEQGATGVSKGKGVWYNGDDGASVIDLYNAGKLENITGIQRIGAATIFNAGVGWVGGLTTLLKNNTEDQDDFNISIGDPYAYLITCSADQTGHATTSGGDYLWTNPVEKAEYEIELWGANIQPTVKQIKSINLSKIKGK